MRIKLLPSLLLCSLAVGFSSTAIAASEGCIPNFLKENTKYYIETARHEMKIRVLKIEADSCWLSVKEVLPQSDNDQHFGSKKKNAFWININNIYVIRNKT
jgi:hypothetical protein